MQGQQVQADAGVQQALHSLSDSKTGKEERTYE